VNGFKKNAMDIGHSTGCDGS